jgi:hypothetical protein
MKIKNTLLLFVFILMLMPVFTFGQGIKVSSGAFVVANSGYIVVTGNAVSAGCLTLQTGAFTISGNYTNSGTYTQGTANMIFNGSNQVLIDNGSGTMFTNVFFSCSCGSGHPAVMSSGNFSVSSTGILNMVNATSLNANDHLTLNSDVNSSATVAALPLGASITGNVNVQRFIQGSSASLGKRGYRLISSAVYTATAGGVNVLDVKYLLNSVFVSGSSGTANGFNVTTYSNNPSVYLFREDDSPPASNSTLFTTGYNWKGIAKLNNTNAYDIGTQKKLTKTNIADTTTTIPVGNGMLFFFRGDNVHNITNKTAAPFAYPEDVTTVQAGQLNTGTINVKLWFANSVNNLGTNLSYTFANTAAQSGSTSSLTGGFTLVGNPYPSTINWEKYNRNGTNSSIYGSGSLLSTIWVFNEASHQYYPYMQKTSISSVADSTTSIDPGTAIGSSSNMIASGQGFFIKANAANSQTLSFRETAKTNTQPTAASLHNLMSIPNARPKEFVTRPEPLFRLKLVKDSINTDEIAIRMNRKASTKFVEGEDAQDMGGSGAFESLSAFSSDSVALAIDFMPFPGREQEVVPLLVDATASGAYQLINTKLDNLQPVYEIWLKDAFTKDSLLMKTNATYPFTIDKSNPATFGRNRFTIVIGQDTAFAYKLLNFTASKMPAAPQVQLVWKTANEQNLINFTVERSIDGGKTFEVVGGLPATSAGNYSLLDKKPINGLNLYRLKQEDINNIITYSNVVRVQYPDLGNNIAVNNITVYPNPATSVINITIPNETATKHSYTYRIANSSGLIVKQVTSQQSNWKPNISDLRPGGYLVKVLSTADNSIIGNSKFIKL